MSKPTKHEKQRIGQLDAVLKHMDQLRTDVGQLINSLQRERDLSRASGMIRSLQKARSRIRSPRHKHADKR
jgi:flagellin-like hook-associated protein FlgL